MLKNIKIDLKIKFLKFLYF